MSTPRRYFGANSVVGGQVRRLDASSFQELVRNYFNTPVLLPVTREEYHAAQEEDRKTLKDNGYVTPCSFPDGTARRCDANADMVQLVCLDLDPQIGDNRFVKDFFEHPDTVADALWPYSYVLYTTASHTPESPRLRVIVPVDPCPKEHYRRLSRHVALNLLGIPGDFKGSRESGVVSQPMYRPVCFKGETAGGMLGSRLDGRDLSIGDVPEDDGLGSAGSGYAYLPADEVSSDLSHLPIAELTVADVREALFAIDSDCDYNIWTRAISALRHQFRGEEEAEAAFALAVEWSARSDTKFPGHDGVMAKWKSYRPDATGRAPVTIRSLFHIASEQYGWQGTRIAAKLKDSILKRFADCDDLDRLMSEGADWISSMPLRNEIVEDFLIKSLRARMHELGAVRPDMGAIKRQVRKERVVRLRERSKDCPAWLLPWCYVSGENIFYNSLNACRVVPEAFNRTFASHLMPKDDGASAENGCKPSVMPADYALNLDLIPKVDGVVYDPRYGNDGVFFGRDGMTFVNTYRTSTIPKLNERGAGNAMKHWMHHLNRIIREPWICDLITDWAAWIVQNPGSKCRWQFFIQGAQGCGKTFILNLLGAAIGQENVKLVGPGVIKGDFNDWAVGAQVCGIEEVWVQGKERAQIMNALKEVASNDHISLNRKFRDVTKVENFVNLIAFSNHHNGLYLEESDRRWCVVKCSLQSKDQVARLNDEQYGSAPYFDALASLKDKDAGALRFGLMNHRISAGFNPNGPAPWTPYRRELVEESKNPLLRKIEDIIDDDAGLIGKDVVFLPALEDKVRRDLYNNHSAAHFLNLLGYRVHAQGDRFRINGDKGTVFYHPERFDEALGDPFEILLERHDKTPDETI